MCKNHTGSAFFTSIIPASSAPNAVSVARPVRFPHTDYRWQISSVKISHTVYLGAFFNLTDIRKTLPVVFVRQREGVDNTIEEGYRVLPDAGLQSVEGVDGLISLLSAAKRRETWGPIKFSATLRRRPQCALIGATMIVIVSPRAQ